ncbi:putative toxin [Nocardioides sp. GCM10030258]|uniref:putative toxin n=1 Tax=unclassified Nocardioides TaxID=2615069 RepID=UPI003611D5FD
MTKPRIPDEIDHLSGVVGEVKNVGYQHLSTQIKDSMAYADHLGYEFSLYVRPNGGTRLSGPLTDLVVAGRINLVELAK